MDTTTGGVPPPLECSTKKCKTMIPYGTGFKTCETCRASARLRGQKKRNKDKEEEDARAAKRTRLEVQSLGPRSDDPALLQGNIDDEGPEDEGEDENDDEPMWYSDSHELFAALRQSFKQNTSVNFHGCYTTAEDPLVTDKQCIQMTAYAIWKATGYRFRVKEYKALQKGVLARMWCSQDQDRKQKSRPSEREGVKPRDNLGMKRNSGKKTVRVRLNHHEYHVHYYDVAMPSEAVGIIRENLEWTTPNSMVGKVQERFPHVTSGQIHRAWTDMSEMLWKRDSAQLPSATTLLEEYGEEVDVLDVHPAEGVEQLAWVMKKIAEPLRGKIVEIGIDTTWLFLNVMELI
ncbi:hypothetical protein C8J57DRAFT_1253883 [Mycena rebaudengoi]|nr:hypothetical protein C8J57DRAFT_1253883 [Mycena rebaudengoi]